MLFGKDDTSSSDDENENKEEEQEEDVEFSLLPQSKYTFLNLKRKN